MSERTATEELLDLKPDGRHERGCPGRYGATPDGLPDSDERAAACQCHQVHQAMLAHEAELQRLRSIEQAAREVVRAYDVGFPGLGPNKPNCIDGLRSALGRGV